MCHYFPSYVAFVTANSSTTWMSAIFPPPHTPKEVMIKNIAVVNTEVTPAGKVQSE